MKKCISCNQDIEDGAAFCPFCGKPQEGEAKKQFSITQRAFLRLFRPSFFGGYQASTESLLMFTAEFLSLSRALTETEVAEINRGFETLLNSAATEYNLSDESKTNYALTDENFVSVDSEKFRYNFVSDAIIRRLEQYYKSSGAVGTKHFGNVWLFALLCALDGNFSDDKQMFFARIKNMYPVSCSDFLKVVATEYNRYDSEQKVSGIAQQLLWFSERFMGKIKVTNSYRGEIVFEKDGKTIESSIEKLKELFPADFDFYDVVEEKIKALCEIEYQILTLEASEGKYSEIADKIAELARQERELTNDLAGFTYQKF